MPGIPAMSQGFEPLGQPLAGFMSLTVGAMPVAATMKYGMALAAIAPKKRRTIMLGSAVDDGINDLGWCAGMLSPKTLHILRAIIAHDLLKCCHGRILSSKRR